MSTSINLRNCSLDDGIITHSISASVPATQIPAISPHCVKLWAFFPHYPLEKEKLRMEQMMQFEHKYEHLGYLCGIDEVGRGPLAGPVVACAVILPKDHPILYLNDSKKLTAHKREELYDVIMREAVAVGLGMVSPARIDEITFCRQPMRQCDRR